MRTLGLIIVSFVVWAAVADAQTYTDGYFRNLNVKGPACSLPNNCFNNAPVNPDQISKVSIDGNFNVKAFGAVGDGIADDNPTPAGAVTSVTTGIQGAVNAACASVSAGTNGQAATAFFPAGVYKISYPILSQCAGTNSTPVNFKGETPGSVVITSTNTALFPRIMHRSGGYLSTITGAAPGGNIIGASLATGAGGSLQWGANSAQYLDLEDAWPTFSSAYPLNGLAGFTIRGFFNYAGGGGTPTYLFSSKGQDLPIPNVTGALALYLTPGSPNTLGATIRTTTTQPNGTGCSGGSITTGTTYEFEMSYSSSDGYMRIFYGIPGNTTTQACSVAVTGTIMQAPSETVALGDGGYGFSYIGGAFAGTGNHWVGQLDSIDLEKAAGHTSTYTAPTTKFTGSSNTIIVLNNERTSDTFIEPSYNNGSGQPGVNVPTVWMPIHWENLPIAGNVNGGFYNLNLTYGSYGILSLYNLYTSYDHISTGAASHYGIYIGGTSYANYLNHITVTPNQYATAALALISSGINQIDWIDEIGGSYGLVGRNASGHWSNLFTNPGSNTVAAMNLGGTDAFESDTVTEMVTDFESGGCYTPVQLWGYGSYQFVGGDFQPSYNCTPAGNAFSIVPSNPAASAGLTLTVLGGNVNYFSPPAGQGAVFGFPQGWFNPPANYPPANPVIWTNPIINGESLTTSAATLTDTAGRVTLVGNVVNSTAISGTAGTATCSQNASYAGGNTVTCNLAAYQETGAAQTYTYPVPFIQYPSIIEGGSGGNSCGTYDPTAGSTTVLTLPANAGMSAETCTVTVNGQ